MGYQEQVVYLLERMVKTGVVRVKYVTEDGFGAWEVGWFVGQSLAKGTGHTVLRALKLCVKDAHEKLWVPSVPTTEQLLDDLERA